MDRRLFTFSLFAFACANAAQAEDQPWSASIEDGGFDGKDYWLGLAIKLAKNWKTYWRVPGEGGIPPQIDVVGDNLASIETLFPVPVRLRDEAGESIGYKENVVFPVRVSPRDTSLPIKISASAFFGVCEIVCIPAQAQASLSLEPVAQSKPGTQLVQQWLARVPRPSEKGPVIAIHAGSEGGTVFLECELSGPVDDIFVEGSVRHYFAAPAFSGNRAKMRVAGTKLVDDLKGGSLRIVTSTAGQGLEQKLTVL